MFPVVNMVSTNSFLYSVISKEFVSDDIGFQVLKASGFDGCGFEGSSFFCLLYPVRGTNFTFVCDFVKVDGVFFRLGNENFLVG